MHRKCARAAVAVVKVHVDTSGYNFPEWKGTFYPTKMPESQMLEYYAQRLATVEINYTFYRMPNAKTVAGWDAATPAGLDRKSTRLNSSHLVISYAVFCLKKKKKQQTHIR